MGVLKARVGGVWVPITQGFSSATVGYIGHAYGPTTDAAHTSGQPVAGMSVTWNAVAGHTYRVIANLSIQLGTAGAYANLWLADAANANQVGKVFQLSGGGYTEVTVVEILTAVANGSVTRKAVVDVTAGTITVMGAFGRKGIIVVEDITQVQPADTSLVQPWQNWTPIITQGGAALGATVQYARYTMIGKTVIGSMVVSMTATGTAGQQLVCTVPVAAVLGSGLPSIGNGFIWRVTPNLTYVLHVRLNDANTVIFVADGGQGGNWGATPSSALTSGDPFRFTFAYEAA